MQVVENTAEGLKREYTITVPADEMEAKLERKLTDLSQQVQLRGFRKGKVPISLLRKMYGQSVMGEVLEEAVTRGTEDALNGSRPPREACRRLKSRSISMRTASLT